MRTAAIFAAAAALLPSVFAQSRVQVTGVSDGSVGVRREITELSYDTDAWNLYLLTMARFVNSDTNSALSYFQISGIHGLPCQSYSGVEGNQAAINDGGCGYCTHSTPLFPAWHRAYVALYEQAFYEQAKGVVSDFSGDALQQAKFKAVLPGFRVPYWDWAMGSGGVPSFLTTQTVTVPAPKGGSQTIANPLYSYRYQVFNSQVTGGSPWSGWQNTLRWPTSSAPNAQNNFGEMSNQINSQFRGFQAQVYKMLLNCKTYNQMADDTAANSNPDCASSLESVHGLIHVLIGGDGHMSYLDQAGFDPTFWLHHTNVDRLLSIWQVSQGGNTWYTGGNNGFATWTHTGGQYADGSFPLTPFYKDTRSRAFWTPNDVQDFTKFGYTYPETPSGLRTSKGSINAAINKLYGSQAVNPAPPAPISRSIALPTPSSSRAVNQPSSSAAGIPSSRGSGSSPSSRGSGGSPSSRPGSLPSSSAAGSDGPFPGPSSKPGDDNGPFPGPSSKPGDNNGGSIPTPSNGGGYISIPSALPSLLPDLPSYLPDLLTPLGRKWEWAANIVSERMGLGGSYSIYVFFGDVPSDSSSWGTAKNLVGVHSVFASKHKTTTGYLVSGSVSLTASLVDQIMGGNLAGLTSLVVRPFLKEKLTWAVKKCDGTVVPNDQVPGLQVKVVVSKVKPAPSQDQTPDYEQPEEQDEVTEGEAGGAKPGNNPYGGDVPSKPPSGSYGTDGPLSPVDAPSGGYGGAIGAGNGSVGGGSGSGGSGSGSGSYGGGAFDQPSCIPNVVYEYKYVTV